MTGLHKQANGRAWKPGLAPTKKNPPPMTLSDESDLGIHSPHAINYECFNLRLTASGPKCMLSLIFIDSRSWALVVGGWASYDWKATSTQF